jgi:hypothetical protein
LLHSPINDESLGLGPNVIGGTGGSGTRVFARIVHRGGMFTGNNLNASDDSLDIGHYLDRWIDRFVPYWHRPLRIPCLSEMLEDLSQAIQKHCANAAKDSPRPWGWKDPRSIYLLPFFHSQFPNLRFLHVLRDGRDMAYSANQNQLNRHGRVMLSRLERLRPQPLQSIALWNRINLMAVDYGERNLGAQYMYVRFEDLCTEPVSTVQTVLSFFNLSGDVRQIAEAEISPPATLGRWRREPSSTGVSRAGGKALRRFGYAP